MFTLNECDYLFDMFFVNPQLLTPLHAGFYYYHESTTLRVCHILCVFLQVGGCVARQLQTPTESEDQRGEDYRARN